MSELVALEFKVLIRQGSFSETPSCNPIVELTEGCSILMRLLEFADLLLHVGF